MKKYFYLSAAALVTLFAASCSQDDGPTTETQDGLTTFTVQFPTELTRTFGDAPANQQLNVAIYAKDSNKALFTCINGKNIDGTSPLTITQFNGTLKAKVEVSLVKNQQYDLVFWTQNTENGTTSPYVYDATTQKLTVGYNGLKNYEENRDAFFASKTIKSGDATNSDVIELKRMFAQVNVGTSDLEAYTNAGGDTNFGIKLSGLATQIDLKTGEVTAPTGEAVVATTSNMASSTELFPTIENYTGAKLEYLAMAYVLVGNGSLPNKATIDVTLYANKNEGFATYPSVPVQMNYRTNIYGALLTNPEVFNVEIKPAFDGEYNNPIVAKTADEVVNAFANPKVEHVVLASDIELPAALVADGQDKTIHLNGKKLTRANAASASYFIKADNGATVTIQGDGTIGSADGECYIPVASTNGGHVVINGGTFIGGKNVSGNDLALETVYLNGAGNITINGGRFESVNARAKNKIKNVNCPETGWHYVLKKQNESTGNFIVNGGTFVDYNPAWGDDADGNNPPASFLGEGKTVETQEENGHTLYIVK